MASVFEVELELCPAVELGVATDKVRLEQRHAATDVAADEVRINNTFSYKRGAHGRAFARMQVRETNGVPHAIKFCHGIELAHRFALNPAFGRGEKAHLSFSQCVHVSFEPAKAGWVVVGPRGWYRTNVSAFSEPR